MTDRIAIIDEEKCRPDKCKRECVRSCPINASGKECVSQVEKEKAKISEILCSGCNICTKACPFKAIEIINLPKSIGRDTVHRFGPNGFKLHRLPIPKKNKIIGLVGQNGIGKSTSLSILSGKLKPNFLVGNSKKDIEYKDIIEYYRGTELQTIFKLLSQNKLKCLYKPQYVDIMNQNTLFSNKKVVDVLTEKDERKVLDDISAKLELTHLFDRQIKDLSGGELQRFAICLTIIQEGEMYIFDEPTSYLDIKQRLNMCNVIRELSQHDKYIIVVEHDLSILDYLSDQIYIFYGKPSKYGICTTPFSVGEGINMFLSGYISMEKLRFRTNEISFKLKENIENEIIEKKKVFKYESCVKSFGNFRNFSLTVNKGTYSSSEITIILGSNGMGKTTFMRLLAGIELTNDNTKYPEINISYKPQKIVPKFNGTVVELFNSKLGNIIYDTYFHDEIIKPLNIEDLYNQPLKTLSGGELQRVAIILCLGKSADVYLLDEPSAYLDSEQRIVVSKIIKKFILYYKKSAFIVEHDFLMATYLADQVILFTGNPGINCVANSPQNLYTGMNMFLENLNITLRRDATTYRPRINKLNSQQDIEQKKNKTYFFLEETTSVPSQKELNMKIEDMF